MKTKFTKDFSVRLDQPVLEFIWRWKVATTSAVYLRFVKQFNWKVTNVHYRLWILKNKGLLTVVRNEYNDGHAWSLTAKGFHAIRHRLHDLAQEGFGSESVGHDLLAQAAHIGGWIVEFPAKDIGIVTEQQLRRHNASELPSWCPKRKAHRPDGYWKLPAATGHRVVALEVESNRKCTESYKKVGDFYNREQLIESVLWIVENDALHERMSQAFHSTVSYYRDIHNFVRLEDFQNSGWNALIFHGHDAGHSISAFLNRFIPHPGPTPGQPGPNTCWVSAILDSSIRRRKTLTYNKPKEGPNP